jgi:hypothetical protein
MLRNVATDHQVVGKVGRLSSGIDPGGMGEVVFAIRGGTETYFAYATTPDESIPKGARVIVLEHEPPRTVVVSSYP